MDINRSEILFEVPEFYRVIRLNPFRRTPGVWFDNVPTAALPRIDAIDRVIHERDALSPGPVAGVERPWYMHPCQDDNLVVLFGTRHVDIFRQGHGVESFVVRPNRIERGGRVLVDGPAMLVWPRGVFHRIRSGEEGSASLNFAVHYPGIDMRTNFNIYDLDTATGRFTTIREGYLDQEPA